MPINNRTNNNTGHNIDKNSIPIFNLELPKQEKKDYLFKGKRYGSKHSKCSHTCDFLYFQVPIPKIQKYLLGYPKPL